MSIARLSFLWLDMNLSVPCLWLNINIYFCLQPIRVASVVIICSVLYLLSCTYLYCSFKFRCKLLLTNIANKPDFEQYNL